MDRKSAEDYRREAWQAYTENLSSAELVALDVWEEEGGQRPWWPWVDTDLLTQVYGPLPRLDSRPARITLKHYPLPGDFIVGDRHARLVVGLSLSGLNPRIHWVRPVGRWVPDGGRCYACEARTWYAWVTRLARVEYKYGRKHHQEDPWRVHLLQEEK